MVMSKPAETKSPWAAMRYEVTYIRVYTYAEAICQIDSAVCVFFLLATKEVLQYSDCECSFNVFVSDIMILVDTRFLILKTISI